MKRDKYDIFVEWSFFFFLQVTGTVTDSVGNSKFLIEAIWDKYVEIYRVTSDKHDNEYCDTDGGRRIWCANELP